jgi:CheY-like chemotaxis protein
MIEIKIPLARGIFYLPLAPRIRYWSNGQVRTLPLDEAQPGKPGYTYFGRYDRMSRILLAESNPVLRSALALLLETRLHAQIVAQVNSMENLLIEAAATRPEIVIVNWELPGEPDTERIQAMRLAAPKARIIVTSARPEVCVQAASADAFVCKFDPPEVILQVIRGADLDE